MFDDVAIDTSKAYLGAYVRVLNKKTGKEMQYQLVSAVEADLASGKISAQSPVGKALLGKSVGRNCRGASARRRPGNGSARNLPLNEAASL